jgi:hypothetical protein
MTLCDSSPSSVGHRHQKTGPFLLLEIIKQLRFRSLRLSTRYYARPN